MTNEVLFFITLLLNFFGIIAFYKFFGKNGLFVWMGFATIMANIEVVKAIDVFGMSMTLGNVIYGTLFLAADILNERYGQKNAKLGIYFGFATMIVFTFMTQVNLQYTPNASDFASPHMAVIFAITPRIMVASLGAYLIANIIDTYVFVWIRKHTGEKYVGLRKNGSTLVSQFIDSALFTLGAFLGVFPFGLVIELIFTTYFLKIALALLDTPFLYWAVKIKPVDEEQIKLF